MSIAVILSFILMSLVGCDIHKAPSIEAAAQRNQLNIPALPIIQESVFTLAPSFGGHRNTEAMTQVCGLALVLPIKLAEARANADIFALIAAELQHHPGLTVDQYRRLSQQLFSRLAPVYLERLKAQMPPANSSFKLIVLDSDRFAFFSSTGNVYEFGVDGLVLR